ncbi:MAG: 1-deoxy-D-xylulose-5-phosphate reductoisomerase [Planctomycetota bacterium]
MRNIVILGASGSVGRNALSVIENINKNPDANFHFRIKALVNNSNWQLTLKQIKQFKPQIVVLNEYSAYNSLKTILSRNKYSHTTLLYGNKEVEKIVSGRDVDIVLSSISGADGLYPTFWAIKAHKTVALANKESLVIAGELLRTLNGFKKIIPVDSEHNGLFQLFHHFKQFPNRIDISQVKKIIITASGGPFYNLPQNELKRVTPAQALNHPTYKMGKKITIDSATLMNKALEIIEAHYLFNIPAEKIEVVIHPQSIIHSMIEFSDGSIIAQMNQPDMRLPIQYALTYPQRLKSLVKSLDFLPLTGQGLSEKLYQKEMSLTFLKPDTKKFPALLLGYEIIRRGGTTGAVLNAANEETVKLFLQKKVSFTDITKLVTQVVRTHKPLKVTFDNIIKSDQWARNQISKSLIRN